MNQCEKIKDYMREFGSISALEAFRDLGVMRLAARIADIEHQGIVVDRITESSRNRYGDKVSYTRYKLAQGA